MEIPWRHQLDLVPWNEPEPEPEPDYEAALRSRLGLRPGWGAGGFDAAQRSPLRELARVGPGFHVLYARCAPRYYELPLTRLFALTRPAWLCVLRPGGSWGFEEFGRRSQAHDLRRRGRGAACSWSSDSSRSSQTEWEALGPSRAVCLLGELASVAHAASRGEAAPPRRCDPSSGCGAPPRAASRASCRPRAARAPTHAGAVPRATPHDTLRWRPSPVPSSVRAGARGPRTRRPVARRSTFPSETSQNVIFRPRSSATLRMVDLPWAPVDCVSERVGVPAASAAGGRSAIFLFAQALTG